MNVRVTLIMLCLATVPIMSGCGHHEKPAAASDGTQPVTVTVARRAESAGRNQHRSRGHPQGLGRHRSGGQEIGAGRKNLARRGRSRAGRRHARRARPCQRRPDDPTGRKADANRIGSRLGFDRVTKTRFRRHGQVPNVVQAQVAVERAATISPASSSCKIAMSTRSRRSRIASSI